MVNEIINEIEEQHGNGSVYADAWNKHDSYYVAIWVRTEIRDLVAPIVDAWAAEMKGRAVPGESPLVDVIGWDDHEDPDNPGYVRFVVDYNYLAKEECADVETIK